MGDPTAQDSEDKFVQVESYGPEVISRLSKILPGVQHATRGFSQCFLHALKCTSTMLFIAHGPWLTPEDQRIMLHMQGPSIVSHH